MFIPIEFQKALQKTQQTAIAIKASYEETPALLHSRFGGTPYWQDGITAPTDNDGNYLALLAQINFAELPVQTDLPGHGILQFFIPKNNDDYGAELDKPGSSGQMLTKFWPYPSIDKARPWPGGDMHADDLVPVFGAHSLHFDEKIDYAGVDTIECAEALGANPFEVLEDIALNEKEETLFYDMISDYTAPQGHKLLGYPYFTQGEPRTDSDYRLLLQIDTDMENDNDIMWGDNGVGHIFIRQADLRAQRFDRVWFYWDCL